jgi:hypothetical protein
MMSITTPSYGNVEKVTLVLFGKGTVSVVNATGSDHKALLMRSNHQPKKIGEVGEATPTSDDFKPEVVIAFTCEESFAVFEEFVANIRRDYNNEARMKPVKASTN